MSCNRTSAGETPFNANNNVQPVLGMMFEILTKSTPLTIRTMEIDTRLGDTGENLDVEIWQSSGPVATSFNNENAWTQIAMTTLIENPEPGFGAIVPTWEFTNLKMEANEKKSIYVRMKGAYIDNSVDVSKVGGDLAYETPDLDIYTGWYLRLEDPVFPTSQTADPAPMFAGRFHYDLHVDCSAIPKVNTTIVFHLAMDTTPVTERSLLENAARTTFESLLEGNEVLKGMVKDHGLVQAPGVEVVLDDYNGECASQWTSCNVIRTTMLFQHNPTIATGEVEEKMYKHYLAVAAEQLKVMPEGTQAAYVGFVVAEATFQLTLVGVSENDEMDDVQTKYLQDQIRDHVNRRILQAVSRVTRVLIQNQELFDFDSIEVKGTVYGLVVAVDSNVEFALRVKNALKAFDTRFVDQLKYNLNFPSNMTHDKRYEYFLGTTELTEIEVLATGLTNAPTPAPTAGEDIFSKGSDVVKDNFDTAYFGYIGAAVGGIALLMITCCVLRHMRNDRRLQRELEERDAERRAKRLLKKQQEEENVVFPTSKRNLRDNDDEGEDEDEEDPANLIARPSRRQWAETDNYDPDSYASQSEKFMDENSLGEEEDTSNVRQVASVYSLGGFHNAPPPKPRTSKKEPNTPHSESQEGKQRVKKEPIVYQRQESDPGDLESAALSGNLFGESNDLSGGGVAAASRSKSKNDFNDKGESSEHSYRDDMTESSRTSKTHKQKKRSKSLGGSSSMTGDGESHRKSSRSKSSKTTSDTEGDNTSSRRHKSPKSSRRRSSRAASGEDHSDRNQDEDDVSEHSASRRSPKSSRKKSPRRSSKRGGDLESSAKKENVFNDPVLDDDEPPKPTSSMEDID